MAINKSQETTITWVLILVVGGYAISKIASKFGLLPSDVTPPDADENLPTAKDYTHTQGFDSGTIAKNIYDEVHWYGTDPFTNVFNIIKTNILTQGDWRNLSNSFESLYGENILKYFKDVNSGILPVNPFEILSDSEVARIVTYVNSLPL